MPVPNNNVRVKQSCSYPYRKILVQVQEHISAVAL